MVTLNRIVAVAMVHGPASALAQLEVATHDDALADHYRVHAVRAHLLEMAGKFAAAHAEYAEAARRTLSRPEQHYLELRGRRLEASKPGDLP